MESVDDEQQPKLSSSSEEEKAIRGLPKSAAAADKITPNFIRLGKHRMEAAVAHLHHQIQIIQGELEELETLGESSLVCKETKGPAVVGWDRWFQGTHGSRGRKRWI
ncbi:guanine nucleotide-binding protein subunit gamma 1-like isoform X2 [Actinidia eriantha]|uniref:guanine nucleotide-binding protein subunit gamma 1-like isoform X2 n=1 Tax=Actinidia eriantha TaxID=165200 RepID=UPI00258D7D3C|nr:guanine nucleotide-binding protein subunit gamma 1-like isoform X2 [Actinidia eriantha]